MFFRIPQVSDLRRLYLSTPLYSGLTTHLEYRIMRSIIAYMCYWRTSASVFRVCELTFTKQSDGALSCTRLHKRYTFMWMYVKRQRGLNGNSNRYCNKKSRPGTRNRPMNPYWRILECFFALLASIICSNTCAWQECSIRSSVFQDQQVQVPGTICTLSSVYTL